MRSSTACFSFAGLTLSVASLFGCADLAGLGQYDTTSSGAGGSPTTTTTTTGGSSASTGGSTASSGTAGTGGSTTTSSAGGTGGSTSSTGGSTLTECEPLTKEACYTGPPGTVDIGICKAGERTCGANGTWGACTGEKTPGLEDCATTGVDENCDNVFVCTGQFHWAKLFGKGADQIVAAIALDPGDHSIVAAGSFQTDLSFGGGDLPGSGPTDFDVYVARLSPNGQTLSSISFGAAMLQAGQAVAVDAAGNVFVAGRYQGAFGIGATTLAFAGSQAGFVAKLDPQLQPVWATKIAGTGPVDVTALALDAAGNVYVTGGYQGDLTIQDPLPKAAGGFDDVFVARFDPATGAPVWGKGFGADKIQTGRALAVDSLGALWIAADVAGAIDFGGGPTLDAGGVDIAVAKLDPGSGAHVWSGRFGASFDDRVARMSPAATGPGIGGVVLAAQVAGNVTFGGVATTGDGALDAAVVKLTSAGTVAWARRSPGAALQFAWGIATDPKGAVVLSGTFANTIDFSGGTGGLLVSSLSYDRFFVKLGAAGDHVWSRAYPNGAGSVPLVAIDPFGRVDFAATLSGTTDFGGGNLTSTNVDLVIGQLAP